MCDVTPVDDPMTTATAVMFLRRGDEEINDAD